jgi:hypothetical protein
MTYNEFQSYWLGRRVDTDGYPAAGPWQCVDLVKKYMNQCFGVPFGAYGNAINYWTNTHPNILAKFTKVAGSGGQIGDIVVLKGLSGNPYGHIGICTGGVSASSIEILEQNGATGTGSGLAGNAVRKRWVPRTRVAGLLRPKPQAPATVRGTLRAGTWNVRTGAGTNYVVMGVVSGHTTWDTVIVSGNWRRINYNGKAGYISPLAWR